MARARGPFENGTLVHSISEMSFFLPLSTRSAIVGFLALFLPIILQITGNNNNTGAGPNAESNERGMMHKLKRVFLVQVAFVTYIHIYSIGGLPMAILRLDSENKNPFRSWELGEWEQWAAEEVRKNSEQMARMVVQGNESMKNISIKDIVWLGGHSGSGWGVLNMNVPRCPLNGNGSGPAEIRYEFELLSVPEWNVWKN